jgi:hypothetical protein
MQTFQDITVKNPAGDLIAVGMESGEERCLEGDWHAYQLACRQTDTLVTLPAADKLEYKRRYANAYLGARALAHGGVSPNSKPRVLCPDLIASLSRQNASRRYSQYPWLQRLVTLMEEIEQIQDTVCDHRNIFHLPPSKLQ